MADNDINGQNGHSGPGMSSSGTASSSQLDNSARHAASSAVDTPNQPPGHRVQRACRACYSRKIACGREPEGCRQCAKINIPCVYQESGLTGKANPYLPNNTNNSSIGNNQPHPSEQVQAPRDPSIPSSPHPGVPGLPSSLFGIFSFPPPRPIPAPSLSAARPSYGGFPGAQASYGESSGAQASSSTASPYGTWPGSHLSGTSPISNQAQQSPGNGVSHSAFRGFDPWNQPEPAHLAPQTPAQAAAAEAERIARHLRINRGEPEDGDGTQERPSRPIQEGGGSMSQLAGIWEDGHEGGGRASARRAWQAAVTYGGQYQYDANVQETRDPELRNLFEDADQTLFNRKVGPKTAGKGRGGWRKVLKGTEHEHVGTARESTRGSGRGRGGATRRGRIRKSVDPGKQFKELLSKANKAYVDSDLQSAADFAGQAIQLNPEVFQAYALLSEVLNKMGDGRAAIETMKMAAVTARTVEVWTMTADKILGFVGENRTKAALMDAIDCYSEALKIGPAIKDRPDVEFELRAAKLDLYREMDHKKGRRTECKQILARFPEKTEYCCEFAGLCADFQDTNEIIKAKEAYDRAFDIYKDHETFGDENDHTDPFSHLNVYLELIDIIGARVPGVHEEGLTKGKQLARWFLDRKEEVFWDQFTKDDREFDDGNERRNLVGEFQQGRASRDMNQYGQGLPIEIRVRMGLIRLKMGLENHQEALKHLRALLPYTDSVEEYFDLFLSVALALFDGVYYLEAMEFFDPLRTMPNAEDQVGFDTNVWLQFGSCYETHKRPEHAMACFETVAGQHKGESYAKACAKLAKLYEDSGETDRARFLANEVIKLNHRELLYEAKVKMVPVLDRTPSAVKPGPLPFAVKYLDPKPKWKPSPTPIPLPPAKPLRPIRPAGEVWPPLSTEETFASTLAAKEQAAYLRKELIRTPSLNPTSPAIGAAGAADGMSPSPMPLSPATSRPGTPLGENQGPSSKGVELPNPRKRKYSKKGKTTLSSIRDDAGNEGEEVDAEPPRKAKKKNTSTDGGEMDAEAPKKARKKRTSAEDEEVGEATPKKARQKRTSTTKKSAALSKAAQAHEKRYQHIFDAKERAQADLDTCRQLWPAFKEGSDQTAVSEWVAAARSMLDTFTSMKVFFPSGVASTKSTKGSDNPQTLDATTEGFGQREFLAVSFSEWHHVFVDLTLFYASNGEQTKCYEMIQGVLFGASVFSRTEIEWISYATAIYCGLAFNDSQYLIEMARKLANDSENRAPMTAQLFAALNRFPYGSNWFNAGPSQKWMLRLVKIFDYMAMTPEQREQTEWSAQETSLKTRAGRLDHAPNKPTEPDIQVLMTYGHMVAQSNFAHSALPYYYRVLALQPDNICVNLCIATMWVQSAMKRQTDNRQFGITEGLAFFYRYYDLRVASGRACHIQEAKYNLGRMWHYLGLTHLAVPAYEQVLELSEQVQMERIEEDGPPDVDVEDFAQEAAFALQGIYSLAGNQEAARALTEKYLVF